MRIRFVTKAQLQVLQASEAEKHLMPDGPIPLFGSLPSAVSRQWGYSSYGYVKFPIAFTAFRRVLLTHQGSAFMIAKFTEYADNNGFTLSVTNLNGDVNVAENYDAQYLAIGK